MARGRTAEMTLRGRIDGVFAGMLRGWLWDPDDPCGRHSAKILLDGRNLAQLRADHGRPDLEAVGFGEGGAGFEYPLPIEAQDGATHEVRLVAEQLWITIELDRLSLAIPPRLHMLRGRVEGIRAGCCAGWAWDAARPLQRVTVELVEEGRVLARQLAATRRPELAPAGIGDGAHGFSFDLARLQQQPGAGAVLHLRVVGSHGEWPIGTVTLQAGEVTPPPVPGSAANATALAQPREVSRRHYLAAARKAEAEQDYATAARLLEAALLDQPKDADLLSIRARVHLAQQQLEPAERMAREVLRLYPGHERATLILARATAALGRHADAIEAWLAIGPRDPAYRERLQKRARSLVALGRMAEAQQEAAMGARLHPEDREVLRLLATTADAAGAPRAALVHWRRLLTLAPDDVAGRARAHALEHLLHAAPEPALASPLLNPDLRQWQASLEARAGEDAVWPAPGLRLRALGGRALAAPLDPQQLRPGELPGFGLLLQAEGGGAELGFTLAGRESLRMGIEIGAWGAGPQVSVALRRAATEGPDAVERPLLHLVVGPRKRLERFDLVLSPEEMQAADLELVLRLESPHAIRLHPPRALSRLRPRAAVPSGFESPELPLPLLPARGARDGSADRLADLAIPFTSILIEAPPEALAAIIERVLRRTAAPFECVLTLQPDWSAALLAALRALAALDPRLRLLPPDAPAATGWVAVLEAPPGGGPDWLTELHRRACTAGIAEAPGAMLARYG